MQKIKLEKLNRNEALRYMGHRGEVSTALEALMEKCEAELLEHISPAFIYKVFDIEESDEGVTVCGTTLTLRGNDIREHLSGCSSAVLLCATIGPAVDSFIRKKEITDMSSAFAADALASAAIEQVCTMADEIIKSQLPDKFFTWRFSPGYGDFPLDTQRDFLNVMNAQKRIGLCLEESNILTPRKSVTAVAGISDHQVERKKRGCASCNMVSKCNFRKRGEHCGF